MADKTEHKAKQLYLAGGWTYAALAKKFKVSERTIIRWSKAGNWQVERDVEAIASQAIAEEVSEVLQQKVQARGVRPHLDSSNPEAIVELALTVSYADLEDAEIKSKSKGEVVSSIEKMLKLQHQLSLYKYEEKIKQIEVETKEADLKLKLRQLNPPTAEEWAKLAFDYAIDPVDMVNEVSRLLRAAAGVE